MSYILVFNGSPRRNGNTAAMIGEFRSEAEKLGHTVRVYDLDRMDVRGCRACMGCFKNGKPCVRNDDFNPVAEEIEKADGLVFAGPVYWYGMTAQLKALLDRIYCFQAKDFRIGKKKTAFVSCCEEDDPNTFTGSLFSYRKSMGLLGWEQVGEVLAQGVNEAGAVKETEYMGQARELAHRF